MKAAAFLLLLMAGSASARLLRGVGNGQTPPGLEQNPRSGNAKGPKVDFSADGGAEAFLQRMEPAKLDRILSNSNFHSQRAELGKMLDQDPDMVSGSSSSPKQQPTNGTAVLHAGH